MEGNLFPADSLDGLRNIDVADQGRTVEEEPQASVYVLDAKNYRAASILGTIEIINDPEIRQDREQGVRRHLSNGADVSELHGPPLQGRGAAYMRPTATPPS